MPSQRVREVSVLMLDEFRKAPAHGRGLNIDDLYVNLAEHSEHNIREAHLYLVNLGIIEPSGEHKRWQFSPKGRRWIDENPEAIGPRIGGS